MALVRLAPALVPFFHVFGRNSPMFLFVDDSSMCMFLLPQNEIYGRF